MRLGLPLAFIVFNLLVLSVAFNIVSLIALVLCIIWLYEEGHRNE
jgi:hypothetical protein